MKCHVKQFSKKMSLDSILDELKDLKKLEKILIFMRIILKKIEIMQKKREFAKIKGSICKVLIEAANICKFCQDLCI